MQLTLSILHETPQTIYTVFNTEWNNSRPCSERSLRRKQYQLWFSGTKLKRDQQLDEALATYFNFQTHHHNSEHLILSKGHHLEA